MRQYVVCYYTEQNDVCTDVEKIVEADSIEDALIVFKEKVRLYKRIMGINEMPLTNMENEEQ